MYAAVTHRVSLFRAGIHPCSAPARNPKPKHLFSLAARSTEAPQRAQIIDLMQALKQSIEKAKPKQKPHQRSASGRRLRKKIQALRRGQAR
jgi:hypothetical protein